MALFRRDRAEHDSFEEPPAPPASASASAFALGSVRLYQPEDELRVRLPAGAGSIAPYMQALVATCERVLTDAGRDLPAMGLLIAVGVRTPDRTRVWCEPVDGDLPADVWAKLTSELDASGHGIRPTVDGPFAFALEGIVGAGPSVAFPEVPRVWIDAVQDATEAVHVPDGIFDRIFAD